MSWQSTAWVREQVAGLDAHAKWVLMLISDHADENGICWPSLERLARDSLLARSTVHRIINRLVELDYVHRRGLRYAGGPMEYRLNLDRTPSYGETGTPSDSETGTPSDSETPPVLSGETPPVLSGETGITMNPHESPPRTLTIAERLIEQMRRTA